MVLSPVNCDVFFLEHGVLVYGVGILASFYGICLFLAYWLRMRHASFVYICVLLLFIGEFTKSLIAMMSRIELLTRGSRTILLSWWWPLRNYISILAILLLSIAMTKRWLSTTKPRPFVSTSDYSGPDRRRPL